MLAYYYLPLWETFFTALGAEVIVSPQTNKELLDSGVELAVDEACLPVKVYMGHVNFLKAQVDVLFLPRIVSVEPGKYTCPKLLGLPDMVKNNIAELPDIWQDTIDLRSNKLALWPIVYRIGRRFSNNVLSIMQAYWVASRQLRRYEKLLRGGCTAEEAYATLHSNKPAQQVVNKAMTIAVIGHAYNIYDSYIDMRLIPRLREMGVNVITPEMLDPSAINDAVKHLPKKLFWTFCQRIMGTAFHYLHAPKAIDGIINVVAFGCGPDSLVGEMLVREARQQGNTPLMLLTIDEHTGEAGLLTRIEAFIDMIHWRRQKDARNFSPHGDLTSHA